MSASLPLLPAARLGAPTRASRSRTQSSPCHLTTRPRPGHQHTQGQGRLSGKSHGGTRSTGESPRWTVNGSPAAIKRAQQAAPGCRLPRAAGPQVHKGGWCSPGRCQGRGNLSSSTSGTRPSRAPPPAGAAPGSGPAPRPPLRRAASGPGHPEQLRVRWGRSGCHAGMGACHRGGDRARQGRAKGRLPGGTRDPATCRGGGGAAEAAAKMPKPTKDEWHRWWVPQSVRASTGHDRVRPVVEVETRRAVSAHLVKGLAQVREGL